MGFKIQILVFLFLVSFSVNGQYYSVLSEKYNLLRDAQLIDSGIFHNSLLIRPIPLVPVLKNPYYKNNYFKDFLNDSVQKGISIVPLTFGLIYNSFRPYGDNPGVFISSKGLQKRISAGLTFTSSFFEFSLQPEYISSENRAYNYSNEFGYQTNGVYKRVFLGQSMLSLKSNNLRFGFSNENFHIGPGQHDALLLSRNAPGFGKIFLSTRRPIRTPIGNIEFLLFGGGLDKDSTLNYENYLHKIPTPSPLNPYHSSSITKNWRYINSFSFVINPKLIPNMSIGFSRSVQFYSPNLYESKGSLLTRYIPAFAYFFSGKINTQIDLPDENDGKDQLASVFSRFIFPKSGLEVYFEYGFADFKANIRDLIIDFQHSSAYIFGFRKVTKISAKRYASLSGELIQLAQSTDYTVRYTGTWYQSGTIFQGYTHLNQNLGIGGVSGSNSQFLSYIVHDQKWRAGLHVKRIINDPHGFDDNVNRIFIRKLKWIDNIIGFSIYKPIQSLTFHFVVEHVNSKNYAWLDNRKSNVYMNLQTYIRL